ncbi:hypothetical protein GCM10028807_21470 [Spirosoma daeguense]
MITLSELKERFEQMFQILADLNICMNNVERLIVNKYEYEEIIKNQGFWLLHFSQLKFILIIQLCKLLSTSNNQKISLYKLINRLKNEKYDGELIALLENNKKYIGRIYHSRKDILDDLETITIEIEGKKSVIEKVTAARDKVYAHYDPNGTIARITFDEIRELVDLASKSFNRIRSNFLNINVVFSHTRDWDVDYILKELSSNKKSRIDEIQSKLKNEQP